MDASQHTPAAEQVNSAYDDAVYLLEQLGVVFQSQHTALC